MKWKGRKQMEKVAVAVNPSRNYREMLESKRAGVLSGMGIKFDTLAKMGRVAEEDQAQMDHDEFVALRINRLDYVQLRMIEEALDRLESDDYGFCLACEEPIPPKRLNAIPWARYCVDCQESVGAEADPEPGGAARLPVGIRG
jgi:DnaK suppressor protein